MTYLIYRICERFGLKFLSSDKWEKLTVEEQASLIGYEEIREEEDAQGL
jgi:hypothetical protein